MIQWYDCTCTAAQLESLITHICRRNTTLGCRCYGSFVQLFVCHGNSHWIRCGCCLLRVCFLSQHNLIGKYPIIVNRSKWLWKGIDRVAGLFACWSSSCFEQFYLMDLGAIYDRRLTQYTSSNVVNLRAVHMVTKRSVVILGVIISAVRGRRDLSVSCPEFSHCRLRLSEVVWWYCLHLVRASSRLQDLENMHAWTMWLWESVWA